MRLYKIKYRLIREGWELDFVEVQSNSETSDYTYSIRATHPRLKRLPEYNKLIDHARVSDEGLSVKTVHSSDVRALVYAIIDLGN